MSNAQSHIVTRTGLSRTALSGQTVVVTGSGRGIGREAALAFAGLGGRVVVAELADEGRATERQICEAGGQARFVKTDVSVEASVAHLLDATHTAFGPVDVLVNNAILCPAASVVEMETALWDRVMAVNLRGAFLTCRACLPDMLGRKRGVIVNMVSTDAMPGLAAYIASKQGLTGFTQSLAAEVGAQGVRVITFAPGMVDTPGLRNVAPDLAPRLGLTEAQFLSFSPHPAYAGLMPADHAGAATAYLVAALADAYHGEVVTGYTVLERAGLIAVPVVSAPDITLRAASAPQAAHLPDTLYLGEQLGRTIAETEAEFNKLPVFIRPMARTGFKNKAGHSLKDWGRTTAGLLEQLRAIRAGDGAARTALRSNRARLDEALIRLRAYYAGVPAETARFSKDPAFLDEVAQRSSGRVALVDSLREALERLCGGEG